MVLLREEEKGSKAKNPKRVAPEHLVLLKHHLEEREEEEEEVEEGVEIKNLVEEQVLVLKVEDQIKERVKNNCFKIVNPPSSAVANHLVILIQV